jgi:Lon protease-like protein
MTQEALALHMAGLSPREQAAFIQSMTDDDLSARIDYLTTFSEQHHAKP